MALPPNFDKYKEIISYFKNNGFDCLSTLQEQFRFFIRYIYDADNQPRSFKSELDHTTSLEAKKYRHNKYDIWGKWSNPDIDSDDGYDITLLRLYMHGYKSLTNYISKVSDEFLYKQLSSVKDEIIMHYFNELYQYGKLNKIEIIQKYITITNKYNDSKMLIEKENFKKYCRYDDFLNFYHEMTDEKIQTFSIDVLFNDVVAKNIEALLNNNNLLFPIDINDLKQQLAVIDFLQINMKYLQ